MTQCQRMVKRYNVTNGWIEFQFICFQTNVGWKLAAPSFPVTAQAHSQNFHIALQLYFVLL
jgi:hypothetical protein